MSDFDHVKMRREVDQMRMSERRVLNTSMPDETMRAELPDRPMVRGNDGRDYKQVWFKWADVQAFATAAVLADRASRASAAPGGEPVGWISVKDRLPDPLEVCDWKFPKNGKGETWALLGECQFTASVPGRATHWRPRHSAPPSDAGQRVALMREALAVLEHSDTAAETTAMAKTIHDLICRLRAAISESEGIGA